MGILGKLRPDYGNRIDGTKKGRGFFGELPTSDGRVATEISIGVELGDGVEREIPALVPSLSPWEIQHLLDGKEPTKEIVEKAVESARLRMAQGLSPFYD